MTETIDQKLADEQRKFDARLAAEAKAERKEAGQRLVPQKPGKVRIAPKKQIHQPGEVAHHHYRETEEGMMEIDCLYITHNVRDKKGFVINDRTYRGKVVVPLCTANVLGEMENKHRAMERGIFEDRGRQLHYGEIKG